MHFSRASYPLKSVHSNSFFNAKNCHENNNNYRTKMLKCTGINKKLPQTPYPPPKYLYMLCTLVKTLTFLWTVSKCMHFSFKIFVCHLHQSPPPPHSIPTHTGIFDYNFNSQNGVGLKISYYKYRNLEQL